MLFASYVSHMITEFILNQTIKKVFDDIRFMTPFELNNPKSKALSLNIRVPFCRAQCSYCLFRNYPWYRKLGKSYLDAVKKELESYSDLLNDVKIESVYFSGGTPSVMPEGVAEIIEHVKQLFSFNGDISVEANPVDLKDESLKVLVDAGVEKISIGVQSFSDGILKAIGREHDSETAITALKKVREFNFDYTNIDLMFSLPEQEVKDILHDLEIAVGLEVQGISTYPLILLPGTKIYERVESGAMKLPNEETEQEMYETIIDYLTDSGYEMRALWSLATKPRNYFGPFEFEEYIGIGPNAWSLINDFLYLNTASLEEYIKFLKDGKLPIKKGTIFSSEKSMKLWFMRKLYNIRVNKAQFYNRFKTSIDHELGRILVPLRLLGIIKIENDYVELTRKGLFYASTATKKLSKKLLTSFYEPQ